MPWFEAAELKARITAAAAARSKMVAAPAAPPVDAVEHEKKVVTND